MSESLSVYGRYVVGLLSVWVRDCRSAVGYESSIVLMIGFQSVSCRLSIGLKSGDSIPNLTRHEPDWFYGVFSNIVGGRQLADSVKNLCFLSVSCRFGRCDWGIITVFSAQWHHSSKPMSLICLHCPTYSIRTSQGSVVQCHMAIRDMDNPYIFLIYFYCFHADLFSLNIVHIYIYISSFLNIEVV